MIRFVIIILLLAGCTAPSAQPVLHSQLGQQWMMIPAGTRIGSVTTEKPGVYFRCDVPVNAIEILQQTYTGMR